MTQEDSFIAVPDESSHLHLDSDHQLQPQAAATGSAGHVANHGGRAVDHPSSAVGTRAADVSPTTPHPLFKQPLPFHSRLSPTHAFPAPAAAPEAAAAAPNTANAALLASEAAVAISLDSPAEATTGARDQAVPQDVTTEGMPPAIIAAAAATPAAQRMQAGMGRKRSLDSAATAGRGRIHPAGSSPAVRAEMEHIRQEMKRLAAETAAIQANAGSTPAGSGLHVSGLHILPPSHAVTHAHTTAVRQPAPRPLKRTSWTRPGQTGSGSGTSGSIPIPAIAPTHISACTPPAGVQPKSRSPAVSVSHSAPSTSCTSPVAAGAATSAAAAAGHATAAAQSQERCSSPSASASHTASHRISNLDPCAEAGQSHQVTEAEQTHRGTEASSDSVDSSRIQGDPRGSAPVATPSLLQVGESVQASASLHLATQLGLQQASLAASQSGGCSISAALQVLDPGMLRPDKQPKQPQPEDSSLFPDFMRPSDSEVLVQTAQVAAIQTSGLLADAEAHPHNSSTPFQLLSTTTADQDPLANAPQSLHKHVQLHVAVDPSLSLVVDQCQGETPPSIAAIAATPQQAGAKVEGMCSVTGSSSELCSVAVHHSPSLGQDAILAFCR